MTETPKRRPPGPAKTVIPDPLIGILEATHRTGQSARLVVDDMTNHDVVELLRCMRIHCKRNGKALRLKQQPAGGSTRLQFAMADKRPYPRRNADDHAED